ncbi:hypothetical protein IF1G_01852 [Cordyceps javanica]|uniref:Uncharacterized protein n=1 Tax=Cordyceps javanica TaxID=43265 RepID=A0A545VD38_9HYPO|nr:hypothetical protein IF1G_01852 [Cordyceps javanica]
MSLRRETSILRESLRHCATLPQSPVLILTIFAPFDIHQMRRPSYRLHPLPPRTTIPSPNMVCMAIRRPSARASTRQIPMMPSHKDKEDLERGRRRMPARVVDRGPRRIVDRVSFPCTSSLLLVCLCLVVLTIFKWPYRSNGVQARGVMKLPHATLVNQQLWRKQPDAVSGDSDENGQLPDCKQYVQHGDVYPSGW